MKAADKTHQVDLIGQSPDTFEFTLKYLAWNDLGNLVGRLYHKMGLKFGHDGLWMPLRDGTHEHANILLTRDFDEALRFMDYNPVIFRAGFADLEDIFNFVATNGRFNADIFKLENRNTIAKTRERKRKTYMAFLKWIEDKDRLAKFDWPKDKSVWLSRIFLHFPHATKEYDEAMSELRLNREAKELFNGNIVRELTGLQDKELGYFMKFIREDLKFSRTSILARSKERTAELVMEAFEEFKK